MIQNKRKHIRRSHGTNNTICAHAVLFVPCDLLIWASAGNQLVGSIPYLVVTAGICFISHQPIRCKHCQTSSNFFKFNVTPQSVRVIVMLRMDQSDIRQCVIIPFCIIFVFVSCTNFPPWNHYTDSILSPCLCAWRAWSEFSTLYSVPIHW